MFFSVAFVGVSIVYCFYFRLVSIRHILGQDSIEVCKFHFDRIISSLLPATRHVVFRIMLLIVYIIPCVLQIGIYRNLEGGALFVKKV